MNDIQEYITIQKATKTYGISSRVLTTWESKGYIKSFRTPGNVRMYRRADFELALGINSAPISKPKRNFCYSRVSSKKQSDDLKRQSDYLGSLYPEYTLIEDVGSGINWTRKGLQTILECAIRSELGEIVVAYRDRLARFGFELIESIVKKSGGKIIVLNNKTFQSREDELAEDLLAIIHVFNCRQMGRRRYCNKVSQTETISEL